MEVCENGSLRKEHVMGSVGGKKIAMKATEALDQAGAKTEVISLKKGKIKGWNEGNWGAQVTVDRTVDGLKAADYDSLLLPGGVMNPDKLRAEPEVRRFVREFFDEGK